MIIIIIILCVHRCNSIIVVVVVGATRTYKNNASSTTLYYRHGPFARPPVVFRTRGILYIYIYYVGIAFSTGTPRFVCFRIRGKRLRTYNEKISCAVTSAGFLEPPRAPATTATAVCGRSTLPVSSFQNINTMSYTIRRTWTYRPAS